MAMLPLSIACMAIIVKRCPCKTVNAQLWYTLMLLKCGVVILILSGVLE